jgi:hypothetical protein
VACCLPSVQQLVTPPVNKNRGRHVVHQGCVRLRRTAARGCTGGPVLRPSGLPLLLVLLAALGGSRPTCCEASDDPSRPDPTVLTVLSSDCNGYTEWQSVAAAFAWRRAQQPGACMMQRAVGVRALA